MAKLYFKYGTMGSGKTLEILRVAYNYIERGQNILLLLTSAIDNRDGIKNKIKSRIGIEMNALPIYSDTNIIDIFLQENLKNKISCVLIDESQFLKKKSS